MTNMTWDEIYEAAVTPVLMMIGLKQKTKQDIR